MAPRRPELLDREQIEALIECSMVLLDTFAERWAQGDPDDPEGNREASDGVSAALEGLRFAAVAIAWLGDPGLATSLARVVEEFVRWDLYADSHEQVLAEAIENVARAGAAPRDLSVFAEHEKPSFRRAVTRALDVHETEARGMLDTLARDPDAETRNLARTKLSEVRAVYWWQGKFSHDPVEGLGEAEALALKEPLQEISQLLDTPGEVQRSTARLAAALDQLPDVAAVDGAEHALRMFDWSYRPEQDLSVLGVMLSRPGGSDAFLRFLREPEEGSSRRLRQSIHDAAIRDSFRGLSDARRDALGQTLFAFALTAPHGHKVQHDSDWGSAAHFSASAWPASVALAPLLDALLEAASGTEKHSLRAMVLGEAARVFDRDDVPLDAVTDRVLQARAEGYPGPWSLFAATFDRALTRVPGERVRATAESCLRSDNPGAITWGLQRLLGELHDPARDPPRIEMAARFYEDPRCRATMLRDYTLRYTVLPLLRRDLRAGALDFEAAETAMGCIRSLWDGHHTQSLLCGMLNSRRFEELDVNPPHLHENLARNRAQHAEFLGPEEFHGPPTDLEWARWRGVRDRAITASDFDDWRGALDYVPPGPCLPEDRVVIDRALARWRAGEFRDVYALAGALARHPLPSDLEVLDRLIRDHHDKRDMLKTARQTARWRLGLPPIPPRPAGATKTANAEAQTADDDDEWLDESDED